MRISETEVAYKVSLFIFAELILAMNARGSACSYIAEKCLVYRLLNFNKSCCFCIVVLNMVHVVELGDVLT